MWNTIRTYETYGIVIDRWRGSNSAVDWVIRDTDGNRLAGHREPAVPVARKLGNEVTRDDVVRALAVFTAADELIGRLESAGELTTRASGVDTWFAHADGKYWRY